MGWLGSSERIRQPRKLRLLFLAIAVGSFVVTESVRLGLRPRLRAAGIHDSWLTGSIGNLGGILVQIFVTLAMLNPTRAQSYRLAAFLSLGYVVYEFLQPVLPRGTFDWNDVLATALGFLIAAAILTGIWLVAEPE